MSFNIWTAEISVAFKIIIYCRTSFDIFRILQLYFSIFRFISVDSKRFNVRYSVIVRLKQRVNQTGSVKERQWTGRLLPPLTIHRLCCVFAVLIGCCLTSLLRILSSLGIVFRCLPVHWRSFTLPVWFTRCFKRTMTEYLTLNRSSVCL
jgi:hypothetical protein